MTNAAPVSAAAAVSNNGLLSNTAAREAILRGPNSALDMIQEVGNVTFTPVNNPVQQFNNIKYVGLLKKFVLEITATIANTGGTTISLTDFGLWNLLAPVNGILFLDLNSYTRIQTAGWHLGMLQEMRRRRVYSGTANYNTPDGNNLSQMPNVPPALWPVFQGPATIAAGNSATVRAQFEIPISFSDDDLRGAMWINTTQATVQFSITANQAPVAAVGADSTFAVYGGGVGAFTSMSLVLYQCYLDQLPHYMSGAMAGQPILPNTDIGTIYKINNTNLNGFTSGQDFPIAYPNLQAFQSTALVYNKDGSNTGRDTGAGLNYLALRAANTINIFQYDPLYNAALTREMLQRDLPTGMYYVSHRRRPLNTSQFGNLNLFLNPAAGASANGYVNVGWESMVRQSIVPNMASLP